MRINSAERAKGSLAMFVSRGLVDPKVIPKRRLPNGKLVNIPAPWVFCSIILASGYWNNGSQRCDAYKAMESCNDVKSQKVHRSP